jgi:release factor glutamine methyltransferase
VTRRHALATAIAQLEEAGVEDARRNAEWLLEDAIGATDRTEVVARPDDDLTDEQAGAFTAAVDRRAAGEPVQYILGRAHFRDLVLRVTPAVLIPRPETEELTQEVIEVLEGRPEPWVLDVGTGSGAIALAIKRARPDAEVIACDASEEALEVAGGNAERLDLEITLATADALAPDFAAGHGAVFDVVVSNPPYVPLDERPSLQREVRDWEPAGALFVPGDDPLVFYRALAAASHRLLKTGGVLVVETHADHGVAVRDLFVEAGLTAPTLRTDLAGRDRIVTATRGL